MTSTPKQLLDIVKTTGQDFEWYPTTPEIIQKIKAALEHEYRLESRGYSLLDCGAGDGRVLNALAKGRKYAIEKSKPLLNALDRDIFVVGTEFEEQTLLDKKVDVVFSNPPYSVFESWAIKIIRESASGLIYLVIPSRWSKSDAINQSIEDRSATVSILGDFDFLDAERKARSNVQIVKIDLGRPSDNWRRSSRGSSDDPFALWFRENFKIDAKDREFGSTSFGHSSEAVAERIEATLVKGGDIVQTLAELYQHEIDSLIQTFRKLESIDGDLLKELNVSKESVCGALKLRIDGLKNRYWSELFNRFDKVTSKLTGESRSKLLKTLTEHTHVDFTVSNAYAIVVWVLKTPTSILMTN
jgi:hypothetical protein